MEPGPQPTPSSSSSFGTTLTWIHLGRIDLLSVLKRVKVKTDLIQFPLRPINSIIDSMASLWNPASWHRISSSDGPFEWPLAWSNLPGAIQLASIVLLGSIYLWITTVCWGNWNNWVSVGVVRIQRRSPIEIEGVLQSPSIPNWCQFRWMNWLEEDGKL